ncbi:MAG: carboxypeptidase-like regulatory domain-containing protein [Flavobacteriales bacterium]
MRLLFAIGLLFSVLLSHAQGVSGTVSGEWSDGKTETLVGATVVWKDTRSGTLTNEQGIFHIGIPPGAQKLVVFYVGFQADTITYTGQKDINIVLKQSGSGKEIIIEGERASTFINSRDPQQFQVLGEKELCKAACCNLSESFETNASVDAAYADAITGTRQIRMLGLEGKYTQMLFDNIPAVRGLSSTYGLTYVPGPWVKNIYITKGVGSITSGYESMTGQINVALKNPDTAERFHLNAYAGSGGRTELNLVIGPKEEHDHEEEQGHDHHDHEKHIKGSFLAHGAMSQLRTDMNGDGFLDNPLFSNISLRNEWHLDGHSGLGAQLALNYQNINNVSGQLNYNPTDEARSLLWGANTRTRRYEASAKVGYVFPNKPWKSIGSQYSALYHNQQGEFGYRSYNGEQRSGRINLLFASRILNEFNTFTTGFSYVFDDYRDTLAMSRNYYFINEYTLNRQERVPGVFFEYTFKARDKFTLVAGLREDLHNVYGALFTPRLHARYTINDHTTLKAVGGMGYRTAVLVMDNVGMLASNRMIQIQGDAAPSNKYQGLDIEKSRNAGLILTWKGDIRFRPATLSLDAFITDFESQVVVDYETPRYVYIYNLEGKSYSNSAQAELQWSPARRFDVRMAYRWLEARTQYREGMRDRPLVNRHRAFTNLAYETRKKSTGSQWRFDATVQWISRKRIPYVISNHSEHTNEPLSSWSNDYWQVMAQATYVFKTNLEVYIGGENLTNFMVHDAIIMSNEPSSSLFDGSLLWGPVFGRMGYVGLRWIL